MINFYILLSIPSETPSAIAISGEGEDYSLVLEVVLSAWCLLIQ